MASDSCFDTLKSAIILFDAFTRAHTLFLLITFIIKSHLLTLVNVLMN